MLRLEDLAQEMLKLSHAPDVTAVLIDQLRQNPSGIEDFVTVLRQFLATLDEADKPVEPKPLPAYSSLSSEGLMDLLLDQVASTLPHPTLEILGKERDAVIEFTRHLIERLEKLEKPTSPEWTF